MFCLRRIYGRSFVFLGEFGSGGPFYASFLIDEWGNVLNASWLVFRYLFSEMTDLLEMRLDGGEDDEIFRFNELPCISATFSQTTILWYQPSPTLLSRVLTYMPKVLRTRQHA
jgi:hypothetical protein